MTIEDISIMLSLRVSRIGVYPVIGDDPYKFYFKKDGVLMRDLIALFIRPFEASCNPHFKYGEAFVAVVSLLYRSDSTQSCTIFIF